MKNITQSAETILFEQARHLARRAHATWRCIYFNVSALDPKETHDLHRTAALGNLSELLEDTEGTIFQCHDGDVFILFQGAVLPLLRKLGKAIEELRPERVLNPDPDSPFLLFDLGMQWAPFFALCRLKFMQVITSDPETGHPGWNYDELKAPAHA